MKTRKILIYICLTVISLLPSLSLANTPWRSTLSPLSQTDNSAEIRRLFGQANRAYKIQDYTEAEKIYQRILELDLDSRTEAFAYAGIAQTLRVRGKLNEAIEAYQNSLEADPDFFFSRVNLGTTLYQAGQREQAQLTLDNAREFLPTKIKFLDSLNNYTLLSKGLRQTDRFHESIQIIRQAIELNPYVANGAHCQLIFEVLQPLEIPVSLTMSQYRSARCELKISSPQKSTLQEKSKTINETIRNAIARESQYAEIYKKTGLIQLVMMQPHTLFQPDYPNDRLSEAYSIAHLNLGISLLNRAMITGDVLSAKEATISLQNSIKHNSDYPWTYLYLGIALISLERWEEAVLVTQQTLQLSPVKAINGSPANSHSWAYNIMGYAHQLQGDFDTAIAEYKSAVKLDETFTSAQNNLQEIE